jgi:hypothetical protein
MSAKYEFASSNTTRTVFAINFSMETSTAPLAGSERNNIFQRSCLRVSYALPHARKDQLVHVIPCRNLPHKVRFFCFVHYSLTCDYRAFYYSYVSKPHCYEIN